MTPSILSRSLSSSFACRTPHCVCVCICLYARVIFTPNSCLLNGKFSKPSAKTKFCAKIAWTIKKWHHKRFAVNTDLAQVSEESEKKVNNAGILTYCMTLVYCSSTTQACWGCLVVCCSQNFHPFKCVTPIWSSFSVACIRNENRNAASQVCMCVRGSDDVIQRQLHQKNDYEWLNCALRCSNGKFLMENKCVCSRMNRMKWDLDIRRCIEQTFDIAKTKAKKKTEQSKK